MDLSEWRRWWRKRGEDELRALLMDSWDPVHVKEEPLAADEYDSYMLPLARKLREGASAVEVAGILDEAEVQMGWAPAGRNAGVADAIIRWYGDSTGTSGEPSD